MYPQYLVLAQAVLLVVLLGVIVDMHLRRSKLESEFNRIKTIRDGQLKELSEINEALAARLNKANNETARLRALIERQLRTQKRRSLIGTVAAVIAASAQTIQLLMALNVLPTP